MFSEVYAVQVLYLDGLLASSRVPTTSLLYVIYDLCFQACMWMM